MRIALVSPYSWTYQGGVNRHVEALAEQFIARGDHVRVLAPWDPPDAISRRLHRSHPELQGGSRTTWFRSGGPSGTGRTARLEPLLLPGGPDLAPPRAARPATTTSCTCTSRSAPLVGWDAMTFRGAPVVGTFHAYSTKAFPNHVATLLGARRRMNQLSARIAVSEAAAWTGAPLVRRRVHDRPERRRHRGRAAGPEARRATSCGCSSSAAPRSARACRSCSPPSRRWSSMFPSRLTVVGADPEEISRRVGDPDLMKHIDVLGKVSDSILWRQLGEADLLCAPSLAGESFGMVLIEAMAAGTGVVASAIAGYSDVVTNGVDGVLVPPADPQALAEELQLLAHEPERIGRWARRGAAAPSATPGRGSPRRSPQVYERAIEPAPAPIWPPEEFARRTGLVRIDGGPSDPPSACPRSSRLRHDARSRGRRVARKAGVAVAEHPRTRPDRPRCPPHRRRPGGAAASSTRTSSGC